MKHRNLFPLCLVFFVLSCSKADLMKTNPSNVYIGGTLGNKGVVWKNGIPNEIPGAGSVTAISVSGKDVYALSGNTYWKNGNPVILQDLIIGYTILANGQDVYVIGQTLASSGSGPNPQPAAVYWKNGKMVNLTQNITNIEYAYTTGIAISGNDVYISGFLWVNGNNGNFAVYWKNGVLNYLPDGGLAKCIAVSDNNVYVGGTTMRQGDAYWVNGVKQLIDNNSYINAIIALPGNTVYIAGYNLIGSQQAYYWKNGSKVLLPDGIAATGIAFSGNDIYCSGFDSSGNAIYWKNALLDTLGNGAATGIALGY